MCNANNDKATIMGIWLPDYWIDFDLETLRKLRSQGFNGIIVRTMWKDGDDISSYTARMIKNFECAVKAGFEFMLVDFAQGLGNRGIEKNNPNYNYREVISQFSKLSSQVKLYYYLGEPIESYLENKLLSEEELVDLLKERVQLSNGHLFVDGTRRNINKLHDMIKPYGNSIIIACSSYFGQHKYWNLLNAIWIYGQLKFDGSLRYKYLSKLAGRLNIKVRFLYQGDPGKFSIKEPYTWLNSLLQLLGLRKVFESWQRRRFVKYFS